MSKMRKNILVSLSVVGALALTVTANEMIFGSGQFGQSLRNPASHMAGMIRSASRNVERALASHLANLEDRDLASIARKPNKVETLKFGVLGGKYALTLEDDKITEIAFVDTPGSVGRPTNVNDRRSFLNRYKELFDITGDIKTVSVNAEGGNIVETFRAKSKTDDMQTVISFVMDDLDRLIAVRTKKVSALRIF